MSIIFSPKSRKGRITQRRRRTNVSYFPFSFFFLLVSVFFSTSTLSLFEWKVTTLLLQTWQPINSFFSPKQRKLLPSFLLKLITLSLRLSAAKRKLPTAVSSPSSFISRSCQKKGNPLFVFVALLYSQEDVSSMKP